ncbi:DUF4386 domain-containing protein [Lentzea alba]|uniref:DUF4386 domain-containing protein n=1 Tax=Lentzea alba TaxID=2714351 RepID=UPI0039BEE3C3
MTARVVGSLYIIATAAGVASTATQGTARGLCVFLMALAVAFIAPTLFPVLKQHGEGLAMGYVVARTLEAAFLVPAAAAAIAHLQIDDVWGHSSAVFFCASVVLLNYSLFRTKLVPRWISVWGLIAVLPYAVGALLALLAHTQVPVMFVPLAINEMVLAVWLLTKGFRRP